MNYHLLFKLLTIFIFVGAAGLHTSYAKKSVSATKKLSNTIHPPVFSHDGGPFTTSFDLGLSAAADAQIYYTTDGSRPEPDNGTLYENEIQITGSVAIRARAFTSESVYSEVVTEIFVQVAEELQSFNTNMPIGIINQYNIIIQPGDRTPASITFIDTDEDGRAHFFSENTFYSRVDINKRGSSSLSFPKNMFGFHLRNEDDGNRNEPLLGMPREHNWILYAPYTDMTLMRNVVSYNLAAQMGWYAPRTRYLELFLHDGNGPLTMEHYHGVYVLTERIKWDNNRVNITKIGPDDNEEPEITGGYIFKKDRLNEGEEGFFTRRGTNFAHVRPNEQEITIPQWKYLEQYMSDFETALYGNQFADPETGYQKYINTNSFIDHFLITELLKEIDGYRLSTFMYKDRGGKLIMGPVWDFNLSLGIADYAEGWRPDGWYYPVMGCYVGCGVRNWYVRLLQDPDYQKRMEERWWELRQGIFSDEYLVDKITRNREKLAEAQVRNFQRWPTLGNYVWPNWYLGNTYDDEVDWMQNWLIERTKWMDSQMGEKPKTTDAELITFWYFDNSLPNNTPLEILEPIYSELENARIEFVSALDGYPFESGHAAWRTASMERRNQPTALNYRMGGNGGLVYEASATRGVQVKQPFVSETGENTIILHLPTTGFVNPILSFATMDEGAADYLIIEYATTGDDWLAVENQNFTLSNEFQLYQIDFSGVSSELSVNDNADFRVRIRFGGEDMDKNDGNRVTFNNISLDVTGTLTSADEQTSIPVATNLHQNYPNPFNPVTTIRFDLAQASHVSLVVFDVLGRKVANLLAEELSPGHYPVRFDASSLPSGLYIYQLRTAEQTISQKMLLIK